MILSVQPRAGSDYKSSVSKKTYANRISFTQNIKDDFKSRNVYKDYSEDIQIRELDKYNLHFTGVLNNKDYNLRFEQKNPQNVRNIDIKGYYDHKKVDIKAFYKDKKHHFYTGKYGDKQFNLKYRLGGLFITDSIKGKIDGQDFYAKFPSASATDANKDLMILLLHLSGNVASIKGHNFDVTDSSSICYKYFVNPEHEAVGVKDCSFLSTIWNDPTPVEANPFNQV